MRIKLRISWLLTACLCLPLLSWAQSRESNDTVSVRELSIPSKAHRAFEYGIEFLSKKDAAGSLPQFQRAVQEFAGYYEAYYMMGIADMRLWRMDDADQAFKKSIDLSGSQFAPPLFAIGAVLIYHGKFAEAEEFTRKSLNLDPNSWLGHYYRGWALLGLNRLEEAENSAQEALRWKNDSAEAQLLLVEIHGREKNNGPHPKDMNEYIGPDPDNPAGAQTSALRESAQRALAQSQSGATSVAQPQP